MRGGKNLQTSIDAGVRKNNLPFAVAMVGGAEGVTWSGTSGDIAPDALFRIFSMTKAVGALAAMILVERGLLDLDAPVEKYLPVFGEVQVLDGFDGDLPRLRAPKTQATIRQLMSHQSGLEYEHWNTDIARYRKVTGLPRIGSGQRAGLMYPMVFDPGSSWGYGIGIDWLGQVIEAIDKRSIDVFCRDEIFLPLAMNDTVFEVTEALAPRLAPMKARTETGLVDAALAPPANPDFYGMGQCLYSTAPDFMRLLQMILRGGELGGTRLVKPETITQLLKPQTGPLPKGLLKTAAPRGSADFDPFPGVSLTHSLGFMRAEQDVPGMRHKGAQGWAGFANTHYWFDPSQNIAAVLMTQLIPFADPHMIETYRAFEQAVYAR